MNVYESRPETPITGDIHIYSMRGSPIFFQNIKDSILFEGNVFAEEYQNDNWNKITKIPLNSKFYDSSGERETLDDFIRYFESLYKK